MRDFRLQNVLTRHGVEGDYVVVDMEYAGPDCIEWSLSPLDKWDADTLNEVSVDPTQAVASLVACTLALSTVSLCCVGNRSFGLK